VLSIALAELQKRKLLNRFQCRTISIRSGLMATQKNVYNNRQNLPREKRW